MSPADGASQAGTLRARNLRTVAALAALFLVPLALAFLVYYGTPWRPLSHLNHGVLITPPRPLPALSLRGADTGNSEALRGSWTLVAVGDGACDADCGRALLVMRQVHLALNRDMTRLARMYIATGQCCAGPLSAPGDPGVLVVPATSPQAAQALREFPPENRAHSVFVVDPLGNLMMSYDARTDPRGLLIDLQKLLRLSHIG